MAQNDQKPGLSFAIPGIADDVISRRGFLVGGSAVSLFPTVSAAFQVTDSTLAFRKLRSRFCFVLPDADVKSRSIWWFRKPIGVISPDRKDGQDSQSYGPASKVPSIGSRGR